MNTKIILSSLVAAAILFIACSGNPADDRPADMNPVIQYTESPEDFPNPERGFYHYSEVKSSAYRLLDKAQLSSYRSLQSVTGAGYQVVSTLVFRYFVIDDSKDRALSATFLENLSKDFAVARESGVKLIPRFVYTTTQTAGNCPEGFICPPYGDAPKNIILGHITQLKPVLQANADVIACVQSGFIGTWGEQYYTDYFGDASSNGNQGKLQNSNWADRTEIMNALLDAVPADRMIQVRYPQLKQRVLFGVSAPLNTAALTEQQAYSKTAVARLGYHNDCFMASENDFGTYEDYGNDATPRNGDAAALKTLKDYVKADSRYLVVGGETCTDDFSPASDCEPTGRIQAEFAAVHYSFINAHYNNAVNNDWQTGGCMDEIKRNLGYRFVLKSASFPATARKGSSIDVTLEIRNKGYASPYNERPAKLILRNKASNETRAVPLATDVRRWFTGDHTVKEKITLPADLPSGEYELLLSLPDAYASISARPEYSIRLANRDLWEASTGYNKLNHSIKVD
ncbi:MAG: DUF4832 domain-containing protein [Chitinophagaceae bacterium]|nr:MAG: DUF4832 domain-containing protein [Chitinophagaceae bacterium]